MTHAATKIQASFRGHMARKELEKGKLEGDAPKESLKTEGSKVSTGTSVGPLIISTLSYDLIFGPWYCAFFTG